MTYETYQNLLMIAGLSALAICLGILFVRVIFVEAWNAIRKFLDLPHIQQILLATFILAFVQYGATKSNISYSNGIKSSSQTSYTSNDVIRIYWQRDTSGGILVPDSATVYIDFRPNTETNSEWGLLAQTTVGAWKWEGNYPDATNYDYNVWAYYIPPEPVHTNGVWVYKTLKDRAEKYPIPIQARIEVNGKAIATPCEKRKDEEK